MGKCRLPIYTGAAAETVEKITSALYCEDGVIRYNVNQLYKNAEYRFYYYYNQRGFLHIVKPIRVRYTENLIRYEICDYLLTKENTLKETKRYGIFQNVEDCIAAIEENIV